MGSGVVQVWCQTKMAVPREGSGQLTSTDSRRFELSWPGRQVVFFSFISGTLGLSLYSYMSGMNAAWKIERLTDRYWRIELKFP